MDYPALAIQPPENPINNYSRLIALKGMLQNQQLQQQLAPLQVQAAQQESELRNQQLQSQKALQQAYVEANGDLDKVAPLAVKYGARAQDAQAMVNAVLEQKQKLATLTKDQQSIVEKQNGVLGDASEMLLQIPDPNQRQQVYQQHVISALQKMGIPGDQIPAQVPDDLTLKAHAVASMDASKQLDELRKSQQYASEHGHIPDSQIPTIAKTMERRWQVLNPGKPLPNEYSLPPGSTWDDYTRIDKSLEQTEKAQGTKAQRDMTNALRQQTYQLAKDSQEMRKAQLNKPTADEQRRADLADNLDENLSALEDIVKRRPDLFGPVSGRLTNLKQLVGSNDPDIGQLETIKHQLGMAQISAHGMRSAQGISSAATSILNDFKNGPEALSASINAARNSVSTFRKNIQEATTGERTGVQGPKGNQPSQPPANDPLGLFK